MSAYEEWGHTAVAAALGIATLAALVGCATHRPQIMTRAPEPERIVRPPVPGAPYTREKEDELPNSFTLGRWKFLPPVEYDHPYKKPLTIARGNEATMKAICPIVPLFPTPLGCSIRYTIAGKDHSCHIYIAEDEILKQTGWPYELVLRHEIGHCNSWPANHPGMRKIDE